VFPPDGPPGTFDVLTGGPGNDTFEFAAVGNGQDLITDWSRGDRITVAGANFGGAVVAGDGSSVVQNAVQASSAGPLTMLYIGTDATPGADVVIRLAGHFSATTFSAQGTVIDWSDTEPPSPPAVTGVVLDGTDGPDTLAGTELADLLRGGNGRDRLSGFQDNDTLDGGAGVDTAAYFGPRSLYTIATTDTGFALSGPEGADTLIGIERLAFGDVHLAFDRDGAPGQAYRLYQAAFDRVPDTGGLGWWIRSMEDHGLDLLSVARYFMDSAEFQARYGAQDVPTFVGQLYQNVLHREADQGGHAYWVGHLNQGNLTRAETLVYFSESAENQAALVGVMEQGMAYTA
jgi:hypothetical protein